MIRNFISYPLQFVVLVLVQVLLLNNIQFSGYINPYVYILFILWLPIEIPKVLLMLLACLIGLSVDVFSNTLGMHTSASIFLAFCRPSILRFLAPRDGYELNQSPNMKQLGLQWFLSYAGIAIVLHHIFLFYVEVFGFTDFFSTLGRSLSSSVFTLLVVLMVQFFFSNVEAKK